MDARHSDVEREVACGTTVKPKEERTAPNDPDEEDADVPPDEYEDETCDETHSWNDLDASVESTKYMDDTFTWAETSLDHDRTNLNRPEL